MRWAASIGIVISLFAIAADPAAAQSDACWFDPIGGVLECEASGVIPGDPVPPPPGEPPPLRYVVTSSDPVLGPCYFWSAVPGGLDAWDPGNDPAVIAITTSLPVCPGSPLPPAVGDRAWEIFRSFPLLAPVPELQPVDNGITGLPTYLAAALPAVISHTETLPDGRILDVRAAVVGLHVDWGDGTVATYVPDRALPHPGGEVTHTFGVKTCSDEYRTSHPAGNRCHPTLAAYRIVATYAWAGEWSIGGPWTLLGTLDRTSAVAYDVDEVVGVLVP